MEFNWDTIKKVLAVLVEYFKNVFKYWELLPEDVD